MSSNKDVRLIVRCAKMYHEENMKQDEIGQKLGISKATVSRLLKIAVDMGIVKITVRDQYSKELIDLEKALEGEYGLLEVIICDSNSGSEIEIKKSIAREAAKYLQRVLTPNSVIGVGNGTTLAAIADYVEVNRNTNLTFVPMTGGNGQINAEIHSNNIALHMAKAFKGNYKILYAPAMVEKVESKNTFIEDPGIKSVLSLSKELDVAIFGVGSSNSKSTVSVTAEYLSENEVADMESLGAAADICNIFIDESGSGDIFESNKRVIGIELNDLRSTPLKVVVSGYEDKAKAIKSVLKAHLADVLITDIETAKLLLEG